MSKINSEQYTKLKAEAKAPYKNLRRFIYIAFGASGFIGALGFFAQLTVGKNITVALPNLLLQLTIVALTIFLFRWEGKK